LKKRLICSLLIAVLVTSLFAVSASAVESSADNERYIYTYLTDEMGLNTAAACGIMGNIYYETNFTADISVSGFYGLFMYWSGLTNELVSWCAANGQNHTTVEGQMAFFDWKMENAYQDLLAALRGLSNTAEGAYSAGDMFCRQFERPSNVNYEANKRGSYASGTLFPRYASESNNSTPDVAPEVAINYTAYVSASALNVRTGPHSSYHVAKSIPRGTCVQIIAESDGWCELSTGGWVSKTYLSSDAVSSAPVVTPPASAPVTPPDVPAETPAVPEPPEAPVSGTNYYVIASALNIRNNPGLFYPVINSVRRNSLVTVVEEVTADDGNVWCRLSIGGWVSKTYLSTSQTSFESAGASTYTVTASALNVRSGVGMSNPVINLLRRNNSVIIVSTSYDTDGQNWAQLSQGGWVSMEYLD